MNKFFLLCGLLLCFVSGAFAEKIFTIKDASKTYDVKIKIDKCEEDFCDDKATVYLFKKNRTQIFQTIEMEELYVRLDTGRTFEKNLAEMKKDEIYGVSFVDYNFDGIDDLEMGNGMYAPYNGPSYDVFLFSKAADKFVKHDGLTDLGSANLYLEVNPKGKYIEAFTKDGCCWHQTTRYRLVNDRLVKIYVFTEDAARGDDKVRLITETRVGKRWKKRTRVALIKDYYDEH